MLWLEIMKDELYYTCMVGFSYLDSIYNVSVSSVSSSNL